MNKAFEIIEDLYRDGCLATHVNPNGSDYHCRFCDQPTKSHVDFKIEHRKDCTWLRIETLMKGT